MNGKLTIELTELAIKAIQFSVEAVGTCRIRDDEQMTMRSFYQASGAMVGLLASLKAMPFLLGGGSIVKLSDEAVCGEAGGVLAGPFKEIK
jgi:hypothetical protein